MSIKVLFISSDKTLQQLFSVFLNNGAESVHCLIADSISQSVSIINETPDLSLIFVGHKLIKDLGLKELSKILIPLINGPKCKFYGTNKAFQDKGFAKYYNELVPINKILIDISNDLNLTSGTIEGFIPFPLICLAEFMEYPFDCFVKIKKNDKPTFIQILREFEEVEVSDLEKYQDKGVSSIYVSVEKINEKIRILENSLKNKLVKELLKYPYKSFEITAQFALDVLKESGLNLPDGILDRNKEAYLSTQELIKSSKSKGGLKKLMSKESSYYFKHVSMTSLMCCYILEELGMGGDLNRQKLCAAASFQNIYLKTEDEMKIFSDDEVKNFPLEDQKRISNHPMMAFDLLSRNPLIDSDILKIIKEHHGDKRGMTFPETIISSSKISTIFQIASFFSQRYLIAYETSTDVDAMNIFNYISEKLVEKDQTILKGIRNVTSTV
jgi:hypothetical protein